MLLLPPQGFLAPGPPQPFRGAQGSEIRADPGDKLCAETASQLQNQRTSVFYDSGISVAQLVKNLPAMWEAQVKSLGREDSLEEDMAIHSSILGLPRGLSSKGSACSGGDPGSVPGSGRSPGEGNSNPLHYSCLENPMNRGAWRATIHGVAESQTGPSDSHFHFAFPCSRAKLLFFFFFFAKPAFI